MRGDAEYVSESIRRATELSERTMRSCHPLGESLRQSAEIREMLRSRLEPFGESIRRATELSEKTMRSLQPLGESLRQSAEIREMLRSRLEPFGESIRRATELSERTMRSLQPLGESLRRTTKLREALMGQLGPIVEAFRRAHELSLSQTALWRFQSLGMATAAAAVGARTPAAFAPIWQSTPVTQFAERFLRDTDFNREFLSQIRNWQFEDTDEDLPEGSEVLSAIDAAVRDARVGDPNANSASTASKLANIWAKLPTGLRKRIGEFITGLILLLAEYFILIAIVSPQEPATQERIREQRKLSKYAIRQLGVSTISFRIVAQQDLPAFAGPRRDAPRNGVLELGQTVQVVQKNRNWCEVIWLDANGRTRGGWVQTRYLRRLQG